MRKGRARHLAAPLTAFVAAAAVLAFASCTNDTATGLDDDLLPLRPRTIEVRLPWSQFGVGIDVIGGYGLVSETPSVVLADDYQGQLDARALAAFRYPPDVSVDDTTGVVRIDTAYVPVGGRLLVRIDTIGQEDFHIVAGLLLDRWDRTSATWEVAVDSVTMSRLWEEPGAGPVVPVGSADWTPEMGDSLIVPIDSLAVATWADTSQASGLRLELETPGRLVRILELGLEVDARPSVNPDTLVAVETATGNVTFIYSPSPPDPSGGLRVGGVPAWRTVMRLNVPLVLDGPPELCAEVTCPFEIDPSRVNLAAIALTTTVPDAGFRPVDTLQLDARGILAPELLPKSPLGSSLASGGVLVPSEAFGGSTREVEIPVTSFVADLLRGETSTGGQPLTSLAIVDLFEPRSFPYATFAGPGQEGEPFLRMIVTTADTVEIR